MFFNVYVTLQHLWLELSALLMFIYALYQIKAFRRSLMREQTSRFGKVLLSIAFGLMGVFGTYWGVPVVDGVPDIHAFGGAFNPHLDHVRVDGIANTRAVGVIVGGLIGGPLVGTLAGLIAGIHRMFDLATFSAVLSGGITIAQGIAAGFIHQQMKTKRDQWRYALVAGLVLEALHMLLLYLLGAPSDRAARLVMAITPAMLITNPIGVAAFIGILEAGYREKERTEALAAKLALTIANKTMTFLRAGLNEQSAGEAANIIYRTVDQLGAVSITSRERVLAFIGISGSSNHGHMITKTIASVIETGEYGIYQKKTDIGCMAANCPLASQITVPLKDDSHVVGTLTLYRQSENSISLFETELACGLAELISTQIEIGKGERQAKLLADAEVKALQAQINPHFLFNALNTIGYYCRKQPETAKRLIVHLGNYYRNNLAANNAFVTLSKEIQCVDDYVKIEMARFAGRLAVNYQIEPDCEVAVPPLILQPLVENAIKHGINPKPDGGSIWITGKRQGEAVVLTVEDDGIGISPELVNKLLQYDPNRTSIGLSNVHSRLISIYGPDNGLRIESKENSGTRISFAIPLVRSI